MSLLICLFHHLGAFLLLFLHLGGLFATFLPLGGLFCPYGEPVLGLRPTPTNISVGAHEYRYGITAY